MRLRDKLPFAVPLTTSDFITGQVDRFVGALANSQILATTSDFKAFAAVALGYASWENLQSGDARVMTEQDDFPDREVGLVDIMAWRVYQAGLASLADANTTLRRAWEATCLSARAVWGGWGQKMGQADGMSEEDELPWIDFRHLPCATRFPCMHEGKLFIPSRLEEPADLYLLFGQDGSTAPKSAIDALFREACVEVEHAMRVLYTDRLDPPGFSAHTLYDQAGAVVGHALFWFEANAWCKTIWPTADALVEELIRLWKGQAPAEAPNSQLVGAAHTVFADEFLHPLRTHRIDTPFDEETECAIEAEQCDIAPPDREALPVLDGEIALEVDLEFGGRHYTRRRAVVDRKSIEQFGFTVPAMRKEEQIPWLKAKVPFALNMEEYELTCAVPGELQRRGVLVAQRLQIGTHEAEALAQKTAINARPIVSGVSEAWMQGTRGAVAHHDVPRADEEARAVYPQLASLPERAVGEYALAFYDKNGIRHDRRHRKFDPAFLPYAVLRNLGLDPMRHLPERGFYREGVYDVVQSYLAEHPEVLDTEETRRALEQALRQWLLAVATPFEALNILDTSTMNEGQLAKAQAEDASA